ncbi:hypothetical protein [Chryseobacterium herbae]|uniref:Uncharacterized protein n=1 Tax=Chryseobacterium herbae TaxID=2976476 RepID=A0ABT2ISH1_9FLAO|nr:hypothetical protein [Chryseobacterium sp. pc1-10]MCT2561781.1 hypothetical protein [Chryseobacterium sp. pc1-10]
MEHTFKSHATRKYLVKITSSMNLNGFTSDNEVEIRWMLSLKEIGAQHYTFELITLDHAMVKADNTGYIEIHKVVTQMQKALNDIKFTVDKQGNLLRVDNLEQIKTRWETVKSEVIEYNRSNTSLVELFKIQDEAFEKKGGVEAMVRATEFFDIYLNSLYGRDLFSRVKKSIPNLFRSGVIPFVLKYDSNKNQENGNVYNIQIEGYPNILVENHVKDLYGGFPITDFKVLKPVYTYNANYNIDIVTGFIQDGEISFTETINEKFGGEVHYKIQQYE